jgi:biopolymer transport protein ExbD
MNRMLSVCLLAVMLVAGIGILAIRQATAKAAGQADVAMQKGISVQMAASSNAAPMPEADDANACIVTVTANGKIYFGTNELTADELTEQMKIHPRNRSANLFVKADAAAPFSRVHEVLRAAHADLFDDVILLTAQSESSQIEAVARPKGLDVWIGTESKSDSVTVQIGSEQGSTVLKVNHETVAPAELQHRVGQIFDNRAGRIVMVKASGQMQYAQVIQAIDACRAAGASRISMAVSSDI